MGEVDSEGAKGKLSSTSKGGGVGRVEEILAPKEDTGEKPRWREEQGPNK